MPAASAGAASTRAAARVVPRHDQATTPIGSFSRARAARPRSADHAAREVAPQLGVIVDRGGDPSTSSAFSIRGFRLAGHRLGQLVRLRADARRDLVQQLRALARRHRRPAARGRASGPIAASTCSSRPRDGREHLAARGPPPRRRALARHQLPSDEQLHRRRGTGSRSSGSGSSSAPPSAVRGGCSWPTRRRPSSAGRGSATSDQPPRAAQHAPAGEVVWSASSGSLIERRGFVQAEQPRDVAGPSRSRRRRRATAGSGSTTRSRPRASAEQPREPLDRRDLAVLPRPRVPARGEAARAHLDQREHGRRGGAVERVAERPLVGGRTGARSDGGISGKSVSVARASGRSRAYIPAVPLSTLAAHGTLTLSRSANGSEVWSVARRCLTPRAAAW